MLVYTAQKTLPNGRLTITLKDKAIVSIISCSLLVLFIGLSSVEYVFRSWARLAKSLS
jgi:hypothetical protein